MAINQRLDLKQSQGLTMTPQLQQAIKLLQMSNLELSEFIELEIEKNPLLERADGPVLEGPVVERDTEASGGENLSEGPHLPQHDVSEAAHGPGNQETDRELDTNFENVFTGESSAERMNDGAQDMAHVEGGYDAFANSAFGAAGKGGSHKFDDSDYSLENTMAEEINLRDHLTEQINLDFDDNKDRAIAMLLLDYLDESGYLRVDLAALALRLGCGAERVEGILAKLQGLDPIGVFARDLRECLALQLREQDRLDPAMQALLDNLEVLASHDLKKLKALCGVDEEDLKQMISEIRALNPKPALAFDHFVSQTVIPDVFMRPLPKSKGGGFSVELNHDTLPRVLVNQTYYTEVTQNARAKEDREYLTRQMNTANWLLKALDQRAQTILKTAAEIVVQQEAFFNYGVEYLKPLVLKDVAAVIGMHESTVSRVTTGKYIGTPRGAFELKYFFTSGVGSVTGSGAFSSEAIKARIKTLIDAETPSAILSDDDLADVLTKDGIDIARRTVAKYREALKIPSSVQRRRLKSL
jgi:RNA polymerase sigma-54 factor